MEELRAAVRHAVEAVDGNWSKAFAPLAEWARPRLRSAGRAAFIHGIERDLGPFVAPTARALVTSALDACGNLERALSAAFERMDPVENPTLAAIIGRERGQLRAAAVFHLIRQEADAWRRRHPSATTNEVGNHEAAQP